MKRNFVVAMTGASGAAYAVRLLEVLSAAGCDVHLTISAAAQAVLKQELDLSVDLDNFSPGMLMLDRGPNPKDRKLQGIRKPVAAEEVAKEIERIMTAAEDALIK